MRSGDRFAGKRAQLETKILLICLEERRVDWQTHDSFIINFPVEKKNVNELNVGRIVKFDMSENQNTE